MDIYQLKKTTDDFRVDCERNAQYIDKIVDDLVNTYSKELDTLMETVKTMLYSDEDWTTTEFESVALKLPCLLYYVATYQEKVGIRADLSKLLNAEKYNRVYQKTQGSIPDRKIAADLETQAEAMITSATNHAYKILQGKVQVAFEMLNSVKKILNARTTEKTPN